MNTLKHSNVKTAEIQVRGDVRDPEFDLLKRYVVEAKTPSGWVGVKSFDDTDSLALYLFREHNLTRYPGYRIWDQKLGQAL